MTVRELMNLLGRIPADEKVSILDYEEIRGKHEITLTSENVLPINDVFYNEQYGVILHSTWSGLMLEGSDEKEDINDDADETNYDPFCEDFFSDEAL